MPLKVYNSLTREKEEFKPITKGYVGMYVCGPTVSGESHLGHARPYITFDIVYRYLRHLGYKVRYVRNITDAGHFEEEGREAEDKISKKAQLEKIEPMELVQKYTNLFHWAMKEFNTLDPNIEPTATGHIVEQINMIEKIIEAGYGYVSNGSVYFDVKKYAASHDYGKLSGRVIEDLLETTRDLDGQEEKRDKADFALWKSAPPQHIMRWKSPWGEGFPGWHIECSAMATKYLGAHFDIHGGGMDLMFPHHESEIAQSTICNHHTPAKYWMHNNMITIGGKKMGKSYNNVIKLTELFSGNHPLLTQPFSPMTVRFFILQSHYRGTLDFSSDALLGAERALNRLWESYESLHRIIDNYSELKIAGSNKNLDAHISQLVLEFDIFINDDFNTAKVIANMFELAPIINSLKDRTIALSEISKNTFDILFLKMQVYIEDIFGLIGREFIKKKIPNSNNEFEGYGTNDKSGSYGTIGVPLSSGTSGYSGYSGPSGPSGPSGTYGYSGYTGNSWPSGSSGYSGPGISGISGPGDAKNYEKINGMIQLLISIRQEAKINKDFATSDKIRKQLAEIGITLKDEIDGSVRWEVK